MAVTYTNFCCRSGGSNLNAGTRTGNTTEPGTAHDLEYAAGTFVRATRVFTVASGDPVADGVAVGDWVSVFTVGSTEAGYVGRVSARTTTTITIHASFNTNSTANVSETANNATLRVGGAWAGPSGTVQFPFNRLIGWCFNSASEVARVNVKNDQTYSMTGTLTLTGQYHLLAVCGYTSSFEDGGRALIQGPASGASFILFTNGSGYATHIKDVIFDRNGSTGTANLVSGNNAGQTSGASVYEGCVFRNAKGYGAISPGIMLRCEVHGNGSGGVYGGARMVLVRTMVHDNTGIGINMSNGCWGSLINCVVESNSGIGVKCMTGSGSSGVELFNCDIYNNGSHGMYAAVSGGWEFIVAENCNIFKNGGYGVYESGGGYIQLVNLTNCCFGAGTQANSSGTTFGNVRETGSITFTSNQLPWVDAPNGDFRINSTLLDAEGIGTFLQTDSGYAGSVSYPSIGACQPAANVAGGSSGGGRLVGPSGLVGRSF